MKLYVGLEARLCDEPMSVEVIYYYWGRVHRNAAQIVDNSSRQPAASRQQAAASKQQAARPPLLSSLQLQLQLHLR